MLFSYFIFPFILELLLGNIVHGRLVQQSNETKGTDGAKQTQVTEGSSAKINVTSCFGQHVSYGETAEKYCVGPELDKNFKPVRDGLKNIDKKEKLRPRRAGETSEEATVVNNGEEIEEGDELDETELTSLNTLVDSTTQVDTTFEPSAATAEDVACPSSCPAADSMVCGRCGHERYHTYLSACHLRMHSCKYPHHGVQLVGRYPCGQYGPINTEFNVMGDRIYQPLDQSLPVTGFN
ncbi:uncharacterized protein LOC121736635 [Aricia agestis]|uniref:uncharacterized protein LOC121736635 n=1 Tax=Aricia agestis TaxID=91739 RepID=UPI001C202809|nr:uncharacterized protein LOC121736635 [Aricia agestis]